MRRKPEKLVNFINAKAFSFALVLIAVVCNTSFGQSITWQRTYDGVDRVADGGYSVCKADSNNFYICGYTTFLPNRKSSYLLKINLYGDTIWTRAISTVKGSNITEARSIVSNGKGGCVITGVSSNAFSISFDKNGEILWNYDYGMVDKQLYQIIRTSDNGFIACGRDYEDINDNAFLLKIDSMGNKQWSKTFYTTYWKNFESITETNNNDGYLIGGFNKNFQNDTSKAILLKVNLIGDSLWQKTFELSVISSVKSINKMTTGYLIGSTNLLEDTVNYSILKVNEIGDILFQRSIRSTSNFLILNDLKIISNNKYVIAGRLGSIGHVLTVDSNAVVSSEKFYNSPDFLTIRSVLPLNNGDILFVGEVDFDSSQTRKDVYALRTDSLLNAPPPIGINFFDIRIPSIFKLFRNYPNPFNPETIVYFQLNKKSKLNISIYDLTGKYVTNLFDDIREVGIHRINVNFNNLKLSSGIYFLNVLSEYGQSETIKLAFIK